MGLPWVRLDSNIASHDKILALVAAHGQRGRAAGFVYCCSLGYSGGNGTDGFIPFTALPFVHATKKDAELLVSVGLWEPHPSGWTIRNYSDRQQMQSVSTAIRAAQSLGAQKANCVRWHGVDCKCWEKVR